MTAPAYHLSFDPARLDLDVIHGFLTTCYWSKGIPRETVACAIAGSMSIGAYEGTEDGEGRQIGFARLITDRATFAWLADVFVLEEAQGAGIARAMVQAFMDHPELQGLRRWSLVTLDAHGVYEKLGWTKPRHPERFLEIVDWDIYTR